MGVYPMLWGRERELLASTVGDFAMPLQPIGSIVPCCVEGVIMELEGEQGHCSMQSCGDTETPSWGHWGGVVGTVGLSVSLRLVCARASLSRCSWTIGLPPSTCLQLLLQHGCFLIPAHPPSVHTSFCYLHSVLNTMNCCQPNCKHAHTKTPLFWNVKPLCLLWPLVTGEVKVGILLNTSPIKKKNATSRGSHL